jgi:hypothetical protein
MSIRSIDIRPGVSVLSVLRHLNYKPWYALAEFVDNSIQSYLANREKLIALNGGDFKLQVRIDLDSASPCRLSIKDNAGGIPAEHYPRAFRPAAMPPDRTGLSEFGMGMKSAACWFAPRWHVRTSALGEDVERTVRFDIARIVNDDLTELEIKEVAASAEWHFTEIVLEELHHPLAGRTLGKIKEHLAEIYRVFLREGSLELSFRGEELAYSEPSILVAPPFRTPEATPFLWKKDISFDFGQGLAVKGFAALREPASTTHAGFSLFRRKRLIEGSADEKYRPQVIFGNPNSYRYQRLFGELHLEGFEVSHTKDGFQWDDNEFAFLEILKEHLDEEELPLLEQAEGWRTRAAKSSIVPRVEKAVSQTASALQRYLPTMLPALADAENVDVPTTVLPSTSNLAAKELTITLRGRTWRIRIEVTEDPAEGDWLSVGNMDIETDGSRQLDLRVSAIHPFMVSFAQLDENAFEAVLRLAAAIGLSELVARDSGIQKAGTFRRNINEILSEALSKV